MKSIHFTLFFCSSLRSSLHNPLSNACADAWFNDNNIAHLRCRSIFRRCVQMCVDICGCVIAAVSKPLLYILHWYAIFQQQRSAGMSQIVKANTAQVIFPQDELEMLCYIVRLIGFSHIVYKDILAFCSNFHTTPDSIPAVLSYATKGRGIAEPMALSGSLTDFLYDPFRL